MLEGLLVTAVPRTLVDLAAVLASHQLERAVHEAEVLRVLDVAAVRDAIDRMPGRRGTGALAALLAAPVPGPTRSELEGAFLALCRTELRAEPRLNVPPHGVEVDALFDAERVVVELDGAAVHYTRRAFHRYRRRDAHLAARGYLTHRRVTRDARATARELARILETRRPDPVAHAHAPAGDHVRRAP